MWRLQADECHQCLLRTGRGGSPYQLYETTMQRIHETRATGPLHFVRIW